MEGSEPPNLQRLIHMLSTLEGFDWDEGNKDKNRKHGVEQFEIEQVFYNAPSVVIADSVHSLEEARWKILGKTSAGRPLVVVFTVRKKLIRPISARILNQKERKYYEQEIEKGSSV